MKRVRGLSCRINGMRTSHVSSQLHGTIYFTLRREGRDAPAALYARVPFCLRKSHARPRVQQAPGLPCALDFEEGQTKMQNSGGMRREIAASYSVVIVREGGRSSIPETTMIEPIGRGVLDPPPARGMTRSGNFDGENCLAPFLRLRKPRAGRLDG